MIYSLLLKDASNLRMSTSFGGCSKRCPARPLAKSTPQVYLIFTRPPRARRDGLSSQVGYIEDVDEPRTNHGKRRVSASLGWAGANIDVFIGLH